MRMGTATRRQGNASWKAARGQDLLAGTITPQLAVDITSCASAGCGTGAMGWRSQAMPSARHSRSSPAVPARPAVQLGLENAERVEVDEGWRADRGYQLLRIPWMAAFRQAGQGAVRRRGEVSKPQLNKGITHPLLRNFGLI